MIGNVGKFLQRSIARALNGKPKRQSRGRRAALRAECLEQRHLLSANHLLFDGANTMSWQAAGAEEIRVWSDAADQLQISMTITSESDPAKLTFLSTGHGSVPRAVDAMKAGASTFVEKPVEPDTLRAVVERALERRTLRSENQQLRQQLRQPPVSFGDVIGRSKVMRELMELVGSVAGSDANSLIQGENGTGKELIGNAIHAYSKRASGPFIKINCAAIPKDLIESELFGYKKGAFTGATTDKEGLFEMAEGGSLLLDEIGEMPPYLQTKLLRVLQEREYRPIGSDRIVHRSGAKSGSSSFST